MVGECLSYGHKIEPYRAVNRMPNKFMTGTLGVIRPTKELIAASVVFKTKFKEDFKPSIEKQTTQTKKTF